MRTSTPWRRGLLILAALSPLLICLDAAEPPGGCQHTGGVPRTAVQLPPGPKFCKAVPTPAIKAGDDARLAFRKFDVALSSANGRLIQCDKWYAELRKRYSDAVLR